MMKKYEEYKESGIERFGLVPKHWRVLKFKYVAKIKNGKDQKEVLIEEGGYPVLGTGGEFGRSSEYLYDKPSVLLGRKGTVDKPQFIEEPFWTVDTLFYTEINVEVVNPKFLFHISNFIPFEQLQESSAVPSMTQDKLHNVFFCIPSVDEQMKILEYLDHQTALIDALIAKKEALIEKLKLQRQAVINEAVTRGLDENVKLVDSGVEWLGEIPEGWEVKKLRYLCEITTGDKDTENKEDEGEFPFFVRSQTIERISSYTFDGEAILTAGDGVGVCKVWHYVNGKFDYHQRVYMLHSFTEVLGKYLFYFLRENFIHEVLKLSAKSTVDSLRRPMFLNFPVLIPSIESQLEIINYCEKMEKDNEATMLLLNTQITKLKLYRQSLISEAVTGKVDLREWGK